MSPFSSGYFYNSTIFFSSSEKGGVFYMELAMIKIVFSKFDLINAKEGGILYSLNSEINIFECLINNSFSKGRGSFLYSKNSNFSANHCIFKNSYSYYSGGVLFFDYMQFIIIQNYVFFSNFAQKGIIYLENYHKQLPQRSNQEMFKILLNFSK